MSDLCQDVSWEESEFARRSVMGSVPIGPLFQHADDRCRIQFRLVSMWEVKKGLSLALPLRF